MNRNALLALAFLVPAGPAAAAAVLTNIGVAAAVRGSIRATAPGQTVGREVTSGKPVFLNDHVTTGAGARMQILLLDETTFTIGPNSDMVLDEFVYDPNTGAGKVSASITKGVFRFVTGKVAQRDPSDMKVRLPVGTIGIRGTMVEGSVDGQNADILLTGPGPENNANERPGGITVTNAGGSTDIDSSGYGTSIVNGGAPSAGYRFSPAQVGAIQGALSGAGGSQTGSAGGASNGSTASNGGGGQDSGGQASATQTSGQGTASGGTAFETAAGDLVAQNGETSSFAAQQEGGSGDGVAHWDQILALPAGQGEYDGSVAFNCTGTSCSGSSGTLTLQLVIDFGTHDIGGSGSNIQLSIPTAEVSDSASINATDFSALTGNAVLDLTSALTNSNFTSASVQLNNTNGTVANQAVFTTSYDNGSGTSGNGTITAPRGAVQPR